MFIKTKKKKVAHFEARHFKKPWTDVYWVKSALFITALYKSV